jgi:hypothetical protein
MRENRPCGSEGGEAKSLPYPYRKIELRRLYLCASLTSLISRASASILSGSASPREHEAGADADEDIKLPAALPIELASSPQMPDASTSRLLRGLRGVPSRSAS